MRRIPVVLNSNDPMIQRLIDERKQLLEAAKAIIRTYAGHPYTSGDRDNARKRLSEVIKTIEQAA